MNYQPKDLVKSCRKLESGLRLGQEGIHACQLGPFCSPIYWTADEASKIQITREMIVEKRKRLFQLLNDDKSDVACKRCYMVRIKPYKDVNFQRLGHIDLAATTVCNLRCSFCAYTVHNSFSEAKYDALSILREFTTEDIEWDSAIDFNGGEPTLLQDLNEYIDYFASRRIRVFLYTNAVKFHQSVYDGLVNGTIRWVCTSLDAGTPSSFLKIKKRDGFLQILENLTRYAYAGSQGGGRLSVKYIFCEDNCSDDDIAGFTYAMLAIRPQQIWLTFDFNPLNGLPGNSCDFGGYDYSKQIAAYTRMYQLMKKHGLTPGHFTENHLASVCKQGKILMERVLKKVNSSNTSQRTLDILLRDFRQNGKIVTPTQTAQFDTSPLQIKMPDQDAEQWSLSGKRVVIVPACTLSINLLNDENIKKSQILGFADRDPVLKGKSIEGIIVYGYDALSILNPDVILVASPERHQADILQTITEHINNTSQIVVLNKRENIG